MGEFLDETLEVKRSSSSWVIDVHDQLEDDLVLLVKSKSLGSLEEISAVSSSLSGIGIEWEESMELSDVLWWEDGVFGGDVLSEDSLEFFGFDLSFAGHWIF